MAEIFLVSASISALKGQIAPISAGMIIPGSGRLFTPVTGIAYLSLSKMLTVLTLSKIAMIIFMLVNTVIMKCYILHLNVLLTLLNHLNTI